MGATETATNPSAAASETHARLLLGGNVSIPKVGPYATAWEWSAECPWSWRLAVHGDPTYEDTVLFAFLVDCAMKMFILGDMNVHGTMEHLSPSDLAWEVIQESRRLVATYFHRPAELSPAQRKIPNEVYLIFRKLAQNLRRIQERCDITINQRIRHPSVRFAFHRLIWDVERLSHHRDLFRRAHLWLYGEDANRHSWMPPWDVDGSSVSIRDWVFDHN